MKIADLGMTGNPVGEAGKAHQAVRIDGGPIQKGSARDPGGSDRVEVSSLAGRVSRAVDALGAGRAAKVASLAEQYRSGTYQVNSAEVSHAMVSEQLIGGAM
jgi:hypothetical protein